MIRSSILRKRPDADYASVPVRKEKKPAKGPRTVKCGAKGCMHRVVPDPEKPVVKWCSLECGAAIAIAAGDARKLKLAKAERAATKVRKEATKRRPDHIKAAQTAFNAWVRFRDRELPCICCGRTSDTESRGGTWDAGHYRSRGSAPHLRFDERNVHAQLKNCNRYGAGRATDYRIGLIKRIGLAAVEALEADQTGQSYTVDQLIELKAHYRARLKQLKEQAC